MATLGTGARCRERAVDVRGGGRRTYVGEPGQGPHETAELW
ncbi:hypothetical protein [Streptomyces sp. NPDC048636]